MTGEKKRAKRGAGTYRTLPSKAILYTFSLGVEDGVRVRKSVTGRTERECREKAAKEIDRWAKRLPGTSTEPLRVFLERWIDGRARFLRPRGESSYRDSIKNSILPTLGAISLDALTHRDVERMLADILKPKPLQPGSAPRPRSPRRANYARTVLSMALKDAVRDGLVTTNVASLARAVPVRATAIEPLTEEEVERFLTYGRRSRWWPCYVVAVSLGLRQGELLALRWQDVGETIRVEHAMRHHDGLFYLEQPKTASSRRTLPAPRAVRVALRLQRMRQKTEAQTRAWAEYDAPADLVFRTAQGRPVSGIELTKQFQRDLAAAGVRQVTFHTLRHTCATFLLSQHVDLKVVSEILGHSNISTTANIYTAVSSRLKAEALAHFKIS